MIDRNTSRTGSLPLPYQTKPPRRILVVEDDSDIRRINAVALYHAGYDVDTAEDGITGWKALHAVHHAPESYDLLITDHDMPGLTGLALVQKLRAARMALPIIMATGKVTMEDLINRYSWFQPAVTLIKPYSIKVLLGTVEAILRTTDAARKRIMPSPKSKPVPAISLEL